MNNSIGRFLQNRQMPRTQAPKQQMGRMPSSKEFSSKLKAQGNGFLDSMVKQARQQGISETDIQAGLQQIGRM